MMKLKNARAKPMGRPPYQRDERVAKRIESWVALDVTIEDVSKLENVKFPCMHKYCPMEVQLGHVRTSALAAQTLFRAATRTPNSDVQACRPWLKCRADWREADQVIRYEGTKCTDKRRAREPAADSTWNHLLHPDRYKKDDEEEGPLQ